MRPARHKPSRVGSRTTSVISPARLCPGAMGEPALLPRLVIRGNTSLSWDGTVPREETVDGLDRALEAFGRVLVWDLDGIERNRPNLGLVRHFEGEPVWVDAGVRHAEGAVDVLVAGAERAVVGTKTLRSLSELDEARELSENVVPLLDFVDGEVWAADEIRAIPPADLLARWRGMDIDTALLVDEAGRVPRGVLESPPPGLTLFAGLLPQSEAGSLPDGTGAIVDLWEVVPRKT